MLASVSYIYFKRVNLPVSLSPAEIYAPLDMTFLRGERFKRRVLMSIFPVSNIWSDMWPKKSCGCLVARLGSAAKSGGNADLCPLWPKPLEPFNSYSKRL